MKLRTLGGIVAVVVFVVLIWMAHNVDGMAFLRRLHGG
jgi:hypothetical protein